MNKKEVADYILEYIKAWGFKPTDVVEDDFRIGMAWNTTKYYVDVEVTSRSVEFSFSPQRKHMNFLTISNISNPSRDSDLHHALEKILDVLETK